jgi:predicted nucleic acid-binding protein
MITAVDANILLDIGQASVWAQPAAQALDGCEREGPIVVCDVVLAEIVPTVSEEEDPGRWIRRLGLRYDPIREESAIRAGLLHKAYVARHGGLHRKEIADFLIGAHALVQADRLLTRDRGFYRDYFKGLKLLEPK